VRYPEPRLAVISYPRRLVRSFSRQASPRVQVALSQMSLSVIEFPLSRPSTADQVAIFLDSFHRRLRTATPFTDQFRSLCHRCILLAGRVSHMWPPHQQPQCVSGASSLSMLPHCYPRRSGAFAVSRPSTTDQDDIRFLLTQRITVALATDLVQSASGVFCSFDRVSSTPPFA